MGRMFVETRNRDIVKEQQNVLHGPLIEDQPAVPF